MRFLDTFFDGAVMARYLPDLLSAIVTTLWLSGLIVVGGLVLGLAMACLSTMGR